MSGFRAKWIIRRIVHAVSVKNGIRNSRVVPHKDRAAHNANQRRLYWKDRSTHLERHKKYYGMHKKEAAEYALGNKEHIRDYQKKWQHDHRKQLNEKQKLLRKMYPAKYRGRDAKRYRESRERCRLANQKYRDKNRTRRNERERIRRRENPQFKIASNLRSRLKMALIRYHDGSKIISAVRNVGCTMPELIEKIEKQFAPGMSWENYGNKSGQWSIDHIKPLASFDLTNKEQALQSCHYTNLRPLWHIDNLRKGSQCL